MNGIGSVTSEHQAAKPAKSRTRTGFEPSTRAPDQTAANAAHAAKSKAAAQLSADLGHAPAGVIQKDQQALSATNATANNADASLRTGVNITT
jgi:hypothetical protein